MAIGKKILQQILGSRCRAETSVFKIASDLIMKKIFLEFSIRVSGCSNMEPFQTSRVHLIFYKYLHS